MMGVIDEVNCVAALATGQDDSASTNPMAYAAATTLATQIATAEAAMKTANTQKELADAIAYLARGVAEEVAKQLADAKARLDDAQCDLAAAVDEIEIAAANERIMVAEVTYGEVNHAATTKNRIALGANANAITAGGNYEAAVKALKELRATTSMTSPSPPSPLAPQATTTITPNSTGTIIPGNHYVRASSLLWVETNSAIRELQTNPQGDVMMAKEEDTNLTIIGGCEIVLNALRQLLEHGLVVPLQRFHA
jgi:hypothetical protein